MTGMSIGPTRRRTPVAAFPLLVVMVVLGGCSAATAPTTGSAASTQTITEGTITSQVGTTLTSTVAGATITASPPAPTAEPGAVDGPCPYLADDVVADINGQHTGTTQTIAVSPYPICIFSRSDGGAMASVRIVQADTPQAAVAAVNQHVPIDKSNPASQPPGWTGGSMVTDSGSIYAVSKGPIAVIAESNQQQSIKGRQMVVDTVANLGL
jgi:hypothetical protein